MTDFNAQHNRAVWFDIPVTNLDRASKFYALVLNVKVDKESYEDVNFSILEHKEGNGGCLIEGGSDKISDKGVLLYMNVNNRIKEAINNVESNGGVIVEDLHPIGPYGFRAIVLDSEGNRIALHSNSDS